jgi:hypothetical protein
LLLATTVQSVHPGFLLEIARSIRLAPLADGRTERQPSSRVRPGHAAPGNVNFPRAAPELRLINMAGTVTLAPGAELKLIVE